MMTSWQRWDHHQLLADAVLQRVSVKETDSLSKKSHHLTLAIKCGPGFSETKNVKIRKSSQTSKRPLAPWADAMK